MKEANQSSATASYRDRLKRLHTRWPAWLALFIVSLLYQALPKIFYWGPRGLLIFLVTLLIIPLIISHWRNNFRVNRILSLSVCILITIYMIASVSRVVIAVLQGHIGPTHLLITSVTLWATNILVFALWYWNLDAGGPNKREANNVRGMTAFLFPQAQLYLFQETGLPASITNWQADFVDYLFLAFNTSTAFSPTDTPVLTRWAKCMCMMQSLLSLTIVLMLAARAINLINPDATYLVS